MRQGVRWLCGEVPVALVLGLALVAGTLALATRQYAPVWQTEFAVWERAARLAPQKPRALNNYGVVLAGRGRLDDAVEMLERAHRAGHAPTLPAWDHLEGERRSRENLTALHALLADLAR